MASLASLSFDPDKKKMCLIFLHMTLRTFLLCLKLEHVFMGWPGPEPNSSVYFLKRNHLPRADKSYKHLANFI